MSAEFYAKGLVSSLRTQRLPWRPSALKFVYKGKLNKIDGFSYSRIANPLYQQYGFTNAKQFED
jgi:hypothetical protein